MSRLMIMSDAHLGHRNIIKYRPQFKTVEEHNELIYNNLLQGVTKRDTLLLLGDMCFNMDWWNKINEIDVKKKILILGNHDTERTNISKIVPFFDEIHSMWSNRGVWFSHAPIHETELRGKRNIHGHTHLVKVPDSRYINACVDHTNFAPISFEDLLNQNPV